MRSYKTNNKNNYMRIGGDSISLRARLNRLDYGIITYSNDEVWFRYQAGMSNAYFVTTKTIKSKLLGVMYR